MKNMYYKICEELKLGHDVVLLSLYNSTGSTPRKCGAKMACFFDGSTLGTIGGGAIEHNCIQTAISMSDATPVLRKHFVLNHSDSSQLGMVCGGESDVLFQYIKADNTNIELFTQVHSLALSDTRAHLVTAINSDTVQTGIYTKGSGLSFINADSDLSNYCTNTPQLTANGSYLVEPLNSSSVVYVFGGGHVSQALCPILSMTDFRVVVYEDNELFARKELFSTAENVICGSFLEINRHINITSDDYAVVLTRGHKSDNEVVSQIMSKHPSYLGVIGSRKKVQSMRDYLSRCGFDDAEIESICSPIGLEIGAQTPAEIAVSITAQLICHRSKTH